MQFFCYPILIILHKIRWNQGSMIQNTGEGSYVFLKRKRQIGRRYYSLLKNNSNIYIQETKNNFSNNIYWVFGVVIKKNSKIYFYTYHFNQVFKYNEVFIQ